MSADRIADGLAKIERMLKELKEFSRLLVILSVALITVITSLHDFQGDIRLTYKVTLGIQLFSIVCGVLLHESILPFMAMLYSLDKKSVEESRDDLKRKNKMLTTKMAWSYRLQLWSFVLSLGILLSAFL